MKKSICILFISLSSFLYGQEISENLTQNVLATSGLKLRAIPSTTGQMLIVIPFGESVEIIENMGKTDVIEWMKGEWVKVRYDHHEGYLFDGFLSDLPVPVLDFELTQEDLDLTYPLIAYTEYHFDQVRLPDTIEHDHHHSVLQHMENGITIKREDSDYHFKATVHFPNHNIGEVYNLLKSMLMSKQEIIAFVNNSIFLSDDHGDVEEIKITLDSPVHIKRLENGTIEASVITFHEGCSL